MVNLLNYNQTGPIYMSYNPILPFTFATLPAVAASNSGLIVNVIDIGASGTLFESNGTIWRPAGGRCVLFSSAIGWSNTGNTTENTLITLSVPANIMTANGILSLYSVWSVNNNANVKTPRIRFSGASGTIFAGPAAASLLTIAFATNIWNRNATNSQVGFAPTNTAGAGTSTATTNITAAVDTTAATTVVITAQNANSGDTITLEAYRLELIIP